MGLWLLRGVLALAALAAPIVTFRAFTDTDMPDAVQQQRLSEARHESGPRLSEQPGERRAIGD
jgi:hypothetical protein